MNPLSLKLRNVGTFDALDLDLPEGILAVLGANGAGKSTLINAIDIALFGALGRSLADLVPRDGSDDPLVIELVFEHGGDLYRVRRSYSPKGRGVSKLDFEKESNGLGLPSDFWEPLTEESAARTQEVIEDLIGFSRATFRASAFLAGGEAGVFCDAQPRERKRILAEILGLGEWERWLERAREQKRATETELATIAALLERAEEELATRQRLEEDKELDVLRLENERANLAGAHEQLVSARQAQADATARQSERREAAEAVSRARIALRQDEERIGASEAELDMLRARLAERESLSTVVAGLPGLEREQEKIREQIEAWKEREHLMREIAEERVFQTAHRKRATSLRETADVVLAGVGHERCDRCEQVLGHDAAQRAAQSYRAEAAEQDALADGLDEKIATMQERVDGIGATEPDMQRWEQVKDLIRLTQQAREQLAALNEVERRVASFDAALEKMRAEVRSRGAELTAASRTAESLGPHNPREVEEAQHKVAVLEHQEREHREAVEKLSGAVARHEATLERLDKIAADASGSRVRRDALQAELDLLIAMERACGPNGVPALILENVAIPQIEAEATRILGELGGPAHAVELHTLRQTKTAGVTDTLDIVLLTATGDAPYESFSTGERARIAFALRLALAQLLSSRKGAQTGLLVIDEIDGLDDKGVHALVGVLEELQRSVPRIIVVSHQAELRDAFEQTLHLENVDGRSRVVSTATEEVVA